MINYVDTYGPLGPTRSHFDIKATERSGQTEDDRRYDPASRRDEDEPWEFKYGYEKGALRCCPPPDANDVERWW